METTKGLGNISRRELGYCTVVVVMLFMCFLKMYYLYN